LEGRLPVHKRNSPLQSGEQSIQNTKTELVGLVGARMKRVSGRRGSSARMSDRRCSTADQRSARVATAGRLEEAISAPTEDDRLGELIMSMRNQTAAFPKKSKSARAIPFLVEQRTSDTKRIARMQQDSRAFKRTEATAGRIPLSMRPSVRR
jgi:hypothetical protein